MGSDGGILGIGTPELATILLVGYFVLGPSDLYKLVKEIGKFVQNVRTLGSEATKSFETNMESQLDLQELRKAQRELNDAFSFRRTINVDEESEAFSEKPASFEDGTTNPLSGVEAASAQRVAAAATTTADGEPVKPKKRKRRRVKKKVEPVVETIPDLDMTDAFSKPSEAPAVTAADTTKNDWFADDKEDDIPPIEKMIAEEKALMAAEENKAATNGDKPLPSVSDMVAEEKTLMEQDPVVQEAEANRFQQQVSADWNQKVMDNEEALGPLALIMERLAILEEERAAADKRLEDEFRQRFQMEEDFYAKKREVLEEAAAKVQQEAYVTMNSGETKKEKST